MYREADGDGHTDTHTVGEALHPCMNTTTLPHPPHCEVHSCVVTLHGAYLAVLQSVPPSLYRGPFTVVGGPLCELGDDGTKGGAKRGELHVQKWVKQKK